MKRILSVLLISTALLGCSVNLSNKQSSKLATLTGGEIQGDTINYYWYTAQSQQSFTASDYVTVSDGSWYRTTYRGEKNVLVEVVREGKEQDSGGVLIPYKIHVRYNGNGEAVYQRYSKNKRIFPLIPAQLQLYQQQSKHLIAEVTKLNAKGLSLYQGEWNGGTFYSCNDKRYEKLDFKQTLPKFVVARLSELDSFVSFVGKQKKNNKDTLKISTLLLLTDDNYNCIERPNLIAK